MPKITSLNDLFIEEIRDLYDAEKQLVKALPKIAKACSTDELREAIESHLRETEMQVNRLEEVFRSAGEEPKATKCEAMRGLLEEGDKLIANTPASSVRDAGIIGAAQRVEHYEMAGYGTARAFAEALGYEGAVSLLQETLDEEGEANKKLNSIAERHVNMAAAKEDIREMASSGTTASRSRSSRS